MKILITGVCGSFGSKLAEHYSAKNFSVVGIDIQETPPATLATHPHFSYSRCNLGDARQTEELMHALIGKYQYFDVVINNVGLIFNMPVVSFTEGELKPHSFSDWNQVIDVTLNSAFYVSSYCAKALVASAKPGVFINISSICANGNPGQAAYSAAKAGLNGLTRSMAKELGPLKIRVASIAPGFFETPSTKQAVKEEQLKKLQKQIPLRRLGRPEELLHAVDFIINNNYFSGTVLELDGGLTI